MQISLRLEDSFHHLHFCFLHARQWEILVEVIEVLESAAFKRAFKRIAREEETSKTMNLNLSDRLVIMRKNTFFDAILRLQAAYEAPTFWDEPKVLSVKSGPVIFKFYLCDWSVETRFDFPVIDQFAYIKRFGFLEGGDGRRVVLLSVLAY
jgi:hypothetical protein